MSCEVLGRMQKLSLLRNISQNAQSILKGRPASLDSLPTNLSSHVVALELKLLVPAPDLAEFHLLPSIERRLKAEYEKTVRALVDSTRSKYIKLTSQGSVSTSIAAMLAKTLEAQFARSICKTQDDLLASIRRKQSAASASSQSSSLVPSRPESAPSEPLIPSSSNKRRRTTKPHANRIFSEEAEKLLEETFATTPNVRGALKKELAEKCGVQPSQITTWFQNTRNRRGATTPRKNKRTVSESSTISLDSAPSPSRSDRSCSPCPSLSSSTSSAPSPSASTPEASPFFDSSAYSTPLVVEPDSNMSTFFNPDLLKSLEPKFSLSTDNSFSLPTDIFSPIQLSPAQTLAIEPAYQLPAVAQPEEPSFYQLPESMSPTEVTGLDWTAYLASAGIPGIATGQEETVPVSQEAVGQQEVGQEWDLSALLGLNRNESEKDETVGLAL